MDPRDGREIEYGFTDLHLPFPAETIRYQIRPLLRFDSYSSYPRIEPGLAVFHRPDPSDLKLLPVFPAPAPVRATIRGLIPAECCAEIAVATESGDVVERITRWGPDRCVWQLNTSGYEGGRYRVVLRAGSQTVTRPMPVYRRSSIQTLTGHAEPKNSNSPFEESNEASSIPS